MTSLQRLAFIGNYPPRRCGIATFTSDLHAAVSAARPALETCVVAMADAAGTYDYSDAVGFQVRDGEIRDYVEAAEFLNDSAFEMVSLQHEYGIFGGEAGSHILKLLSRLKMPIVTTLHTVLPKPTLEQHRVMRRIIDASAKVIVMAEKGVDFLRSVHGVDENKLEIIPHGIPDFPFIEPDLAKAKLGFTGKTVILTFGLLSPNKGIEIMLDAMPRVIASCPSAVYVVLGATHPNLVRDHGEAYRDRLVARVRELGIEESVVFFNQFVDQSTLLDFISMCDVYVTPYLNEAQMTSGTLAYSFGLGKAVVSTPYWHARDLLGDGRGILVPFGDAAAMGSAISGILTNDARLYSMRERAYAASRSMTWAQTGKRYVETLDLAIAKFRRAAVSERVSVDPPFSVSELQLGHFLSLCDSTGLLQHAVHSVADRAHGYCIDDNARALLLSMALTKSGTTPLPDSLTARFAAFIQHGWNPDTQRFRNFMSYDRRWLEPAGSEDSHGRTLWALGECTRHDSDGARRRWAAMLFKTALPGVESFSSPRAWAFTLLGLDAYCPQFPADQSASRMRMVLADRLLDILVQYTAVDWQWFETVLAYDNARLPQALLQTGLTIGSETYIAAGLQSLRWLTTMQTAPSGHFRPVGSESFGNAHQRPQAFDQQPLEAAATISASLAARRADGGTEWANEAMRAFNWFLGANDLRRPLIDRKTGACSDGLHRDRVNENRGAESALSYLLGGLEIRELRRSQGIENIKHASRISPSLGTQSLSYKKRQGDAGDAIQILEPSNIAPTPRHGPSRRAAV
ncbi:MAG: glycosyltransferase family 4 protein [Hyphomicrobium sp.]|jgi:glycosyltransferase involved in cell wall biosynthesis